MITEFFRASKFSNGAMAAEEFTRLMAARGIIVNVHDMRQADPKQLPPG